MSRTSQVRNRRNFNTLVVISHRIADNFFSVSIGTMKAFDLFARRKSLPKYTAGPSPPGYKLALFYVTEFRYESFTPNHVWAPKNIQNFSEPMQLAIHVLIFCILEAIPRRYDAVVALEIEYSIYIIWTSAQLLLRYKSSPALFGPLYAADSISGFWYFASFTLVDWLAVALTNDIFIQVRNMA